MKMPPSLRQRLFVQNDYAFCSTSANGVEDLVRSGRAHCLGRGGFDHRGVVNEAWDISALYLPLLLLPRLMGGDE